MRDPSKYTKAFVLCQHLVTAIYIVIGIVVYYFCGQYITSPSLGSAGVLMKKICYGLALPAVCVTLCLYIHVGTLNCPENNLTDMMQLPAKVIFVRILRGSQHLTSNSFIHWSVWLGSVFAVSLVRYIIASAVPSFGSIISLVGALFEPFLAISPYGHMWLYDNWFGKTNRTWKVKLHAVWAVLVILVGWFFVIGGTYGAVVDMKEVYSAAGKSCAWYLQTTQILYNPRLHFWTVAPTGKGHCMIQCGFKSRWFEGESYNNRSHSSLPGTNWTISFQ